MVGLTAKQKEELNVAIHEYLLKSRYTQAAAMLAEEAAITASPGDLKDILERKWTSLAKLKKEVDELTK